VGVGQRINKDRAISDLTIHLGVIVSTRNHPSVVQDNYPGCCWSY